MVAVLENSLPPELKSSSATKGETPLELPVSIWTFTLPPPPAVGVAVTCADWAEVPAEFTAATV
jgi:hypothetical protein